MDTEDNGVPTVSTESPSESTAVLDPMEPEPAPRCDCPALDVPHTHEPGGPEPLKAA